MYSTRLEFSLHFFLHDCNFLDCWTKMTASIKDKIQTSFNFHPTTSTKSQLSSVIYHQRDFSTFAFHLLMALYTYMLVRCSPLCALHIIWKSKKLTAMCAFVHAKRTFESVCTYKQQQSFCGSFSLSLFLLLLYRFNAAFLCYVCWWRTSSARYTKFYKKKDELRQEILWIPKQKSRGSVGGTNSPLPSFSLYLFDINEMVKSSVKNSINLFWLTSSFFLLSVLLSLPFQLNSFVRCAEEDRWINLRVIRNEGQGEI